MGRAARVVATALDSVGAAYSVEAHTSQMHELLQPVLRGDLVELRPLRVSDREDLFQVASDPLIWEQHHVKDRCERVGFETFFRESLESGGALLVTDIKNEETIGSSRFYGYDAKRSEVEIGWTFLARSHWGGRYNGEMKRLMLGHAFQFVTHVIFLVAPGNMRSRTAVERLGAERIGERTDATGNKSMLYRMTAGNGL